MSEPTDLPIMMGLQTPRSATTSQDDDRSQSAGTPTEVVSGNILVHDVKKLQEDLVKATLPVGAFMTDDHRYYFNGEGPLPSVTTILEILDKPALSTWKAQQAAKAMAHLADEGYLDDEYVLDDLVKMALSDANKSRDKAASIGSGVHLLADMASRASESDPKTFQVSEEERPYLQAFRDFSDRYERSSFVSSEKMVWSLNGYAGTYDLLMMIDHELWLIDIKTSGAGFQKDGKRKPPGTGIYPEHALQLAAYRWADSIILEGNPTAYAMPDIQRTGILHLQPDQYPDTGYRLWDMPTTYESDYITFLGLLEAWKWKQIKRKPIAID